MKKVLAILLLFFAIGPLHSSQHFLILFVDAKHLNYENCFSLLTSIKENPQHNFGHAWIYLQGLLDGKPHFILGGHTGEFGILKPRYFDGVMNLMEYGCLYPKKRRCKRHEENPIKYLWEELPDGAFQWGSGGHRATYAATIDLSEESFIKILNLMMQYDYSKYALTGQQCASFAAQIAALAGLQLESDVTVSIDQVVHFNKATMMLWSDPQYGQITFATPDKLEESLKRAVLEGKATEVKIKEKTNRIKRIGAG